ncbi:hypothetical protein J7384_10180 [Endozoicomonas sp. G2_1]|uniref:hypothetical protein n=1 Tax=Endozoicomonas sp. G2_1 TaxID=2821091 RepID=UPI001ADA9457|nr:hypothetical protein [Endozoicomonas sp. G2_1]MBO9490727.1 hypothetical protein [Endozoicomonas sp. G2_1]
MKKLTNTEAWCLSNSVNAISNIAKSPTASGALQDRAYALGAATALLEKPRIHNRVVDLAFKRFYRIWG